MNSDNPIHLPQNDLLGSAPYAKVLVDYLLQSDTPTAINISGDWGTGKTSLMRQMKHLLDKNALVASSWVNAWEYATLQTEAVIPLSIMWGMFDYLRTVCVEQDFWPNQRIFREQYNRVAGMMGSVSKLAVKIASKRTIGEDASIILKTGDTEDYSSKVAAIKKDVVSIIKEIRQDDDNPFKRMIFFLDNLDRLSPEIAIETLLLIHHVLKVEHCTFVYAISYSTIKEGLTKKGIDKESEQHAFFDKFVQLSFDLPVQHYHIHHLLWNQFAKLNLRFEEEELQTYKDVLSYTMVNNPRLIKKLVGSFGVLRSIRGEAKHKLGDWLLFTLIALELTSPNDFELLLSNIDFQSWETPIGDQKVLSLLEHVKTRLDKDYTTLMDTYLDLVRIVFVK